MKMMMLWASVDPRLSTEPVTERNEIPGAAKLGKIYHFVWSVGTLETAKTLDLIFIEPKLCTISPRATSKQMYYRAQFHPLNALKMETQMTRYLMITP